MAGEMVKKRKACDSFEQQAVTRQLKGSCRFPDSNKNNGSAGSSLAYRDQGSAVGSQHSLTDSTEHRTSKDMRSGKSSASAVTDFNALSWGSLTCKHPPQDAFNFGDWQHPATEKQTTTSAHSMITRGTTKLMTTNALLNTGELLERIISHLPPESLVTLRRVNKTWNHIILTLPVTRRALFLEAEPLSHEFWVYDRSSRVLQPYEPSMLDVYGTAWRDRQSYCRPTSLNPLLFMRDKDPKTGEEKIAPLHERAKICESLRFVGRPNLNMPLGSSLHHDMFLTQPPVSTVEFVFHYQDRNLRRQRIYAPLQVKRIRVRQPGGVRFKDLLQAFVDAATLGLRPTAYGPPDFAVRVKGSPVTKKIAAVWMLGAIFVSEEEEKQIEAMREIWVARDQENGVSVGELPPSPQAKQQMKANNGRMIDFRPTSDDFVDKPRKVRGEQGQCYGGLPRGQLFGLK
ncbi:hypothetical protein CB0940_05962 [Cercospora beticola]|uniref:F-box domain-containing protein n=1 Tax=Cercospora beticola TaxID=122368 RepID=A0A2G5HXE4_CERBT|nr:hypothetical protein CB0940_05962 [Cercospora beticola]PIA97227.1 hypothetical protein CB0940_05962 [Cercospora beticola]WPA98563.1 hypothetical protein RHO25_003175 [Cercospora beticola]